jgi:hypothetical protein
MDFSAARSLWLDIFSNVFVVANISFKPTSIKPPASDRNIGNRVLSSSSIYHHGVWRYPTIN